MELAVAALGSLLPKLATLLADEYKLQKGVRGEIRFLKAEMESMQAALDRLSKLPPQQIDDLHNIWPKSFRTFFDRTIVLLTKAKPRHHIADDIQDIRSRIQEVAGRRERYRFPEVAVQPENTEMDPRLPSLYEDVKNLVGIEGPSEKLTALLMQGEGAQKQQLMVVSIVGVGGLGKTTLANSVYQRIRGEFQSQAFVSVSLKPDIKKIFSSILRQVSGGEYPNAEAWSHTELIDTIRQILEKKRYIIVIDDLWGESAWTQIKCALTENSLGSRVIDSKKLLCKRVLNENEKMHSELEDVSRKILEKCGGIPLAIITTASLLASRPNKTKYEWYTVYNSMGSGLHKDKSLENMRGILYLSYSDLPSYLKPCLLYLNMFPEDYEIPSERLVRLWIAEGFIDEKQGSNLYDLGERYFIELVNRSMIQPLYKKDGSPGACRVHDMILDLIISLSSQENFVTILEGPCHISSACNIRRLSLRGSKSNSKEEQMIFPATVNISHVRSVVAFGDAVEWVPPMSRFPVLRVLAFRSQSRNNIHPKDLGSLQHLRYLELGGDLKTELLEEIGNLKLLRTLDLWGGFKGELPASISQLRQLENLLTGTNKVKFPDGTGNLISLHELSCLFLDESPNTLAELGNLTKLRVLTIYWWQSYVKTFLQALSNLVNLRRLAFIGGRTTCSLDYMPDQWTGPARLQRFHGSFVTFSQVPWWFSSLSELSSLSMRVNLLRQEDLKLLGTLPVLRFLDLKVDAYGTTTEEQLVVGADHPFRSLVEFRFTHYTRCWLEFARGVMPKLQRLELYFEARRREGGGFDIGLENLASLTHVTVKFDRDGVRMKVVEDVEYKVRDALDMHPNHPTLELSIFWEEEMIKDEDKIGHEV
ncbi:disease resistance protein RGA5-like [Miscanthus floridulus]|uniref:disease resistance protein RGA5-like n=1 Tax=Miscanthus floridulus TaxID=154761 RepID=UPI00345838E1